MRDRENKARVRGVVRPTIDSSWRLEVFDRDLRDETCLGETKLDDDGHYELTYSLDQLRRPEKGTADLVVRVVDEHGNILVESDVHFNAGPDEIIDLMLPGEACEPSEFEWVWACVMPILEKLSLHEVNEDDVTFIVGETQLPRAQVRALVGAGRLAVIPAAVEHKLLVALLYGLLRHGAPADAPSFFKTPASDLGGLLKEAVAANTVSADLGSHLDEIVARLRDAAIAFQQRQTTGNDVASLGEVLDTGFADKDAQVAFVARQLVTDVLDEEFWAAVAQDEQIGATAARDLRATWILGELTGRNVPLMRILQEERGSTGATEWHQLAVRDVDDWVAILEDDIVPPGVPGEDPPTRRRAYATSLVQQVETRYPTAVMAETLHRSGSGGTTGDATVTFLRGATDFDILHTPVGEYVASLDGGPPGADVVAEVEKVQRVRRSTGGAAETVAVLDAGYVSAAGIANGGRRSFEDLSARVGPVIAARIQRDATLRAQVAQTLLLQIWELTSGSLPAALGGGMQHDDSAQWRTLFGSVDFCECEHCSSVLSPAAYLVDLLEFLRERASTISGRSALDVLLEDGSFQGFMRRRPDIQHIDLSCANTHTELVYIDLVNEILEDAISPQNPPARQTTRSAQELAVAPEHMQVGVYETLRSDDAVYPWILPYDVWTDLARVYFGELGVDRAVLLEHFGAPAADVDAERLGLIPAQWQIISTSAADAVWRYWGFAGPTEELAVLARLLERTRLSFDVLEALGETAFVGPLEFEGLESCDTQEVSVVNLDEARLDRMHRFLRLQRALGWSARVLDDAITMLGEGRLDEPCLHRLAGLVRSAQALGWTPGQSIRYYAVEAGRRQLLSDALSISEEEVALLERLLELDLDDRTQPGGLYELAHEAGRLTAGAMSLGNLGYVVLGDASLGDAAPDDARVARHLDEIRRELRSVTDADRSVLLAEMIAGYLESSPAVLETIFVEHPDVAAPLLADGFITGDLSTPVTADSFGDEFASYRQLARAIFAASTLDAESTRWSWIFASPPPSPAVALATLLPPEPADPIATVGLDPAVVEEWAREPNAPRVEAMLDAVRERHDDAKWPEVGRRLRDPVRERQTAALSAYLLGSGRPAGQAWTDHRDLYAHLLVDPQMTSCATTSRIKLAHQSVQLFVQRALMGLEKDVVADVERDDDWAQWRWRKSYRVWEAGLRIFMHPENWLEPELRDDKTPLFLALENHLLQDDINDDRAEDALVAYLEHLDEIAQLRVAGFVTQNEEDGEQILHTFARTTNDPPRYYYRRQVQREHGSYWTAWEKVSLAIDQWSTLLPVVWNRKLYLFWLQLTEKNEPPEMTMPGEGDPFDEGRTFVEARLAWSSYRRGKWSEKKLSEPAVEFPDLARTTLRLHAVHGDDGSLAVVCEPVIAPGDLSDSLDEFQEQLRRASEEGAGGVFGMIGDGLEDAFEALRGIARSLSYEFRFRTPSSSPEVSTVPSGTVLPDEDWSFLGTAVHAGDGELSVMPDMRHVLMRAVGDDALRLVPPNRAPFSVPHELFVSDTRRTFFLDWEAPKELVERIRQLMSEGSVFAALIVALAAIGATRYMAQPFYHPFVTLLLAELHRLGVRGLYQRQLQLDPATRAGADGLDFARDYGIHRALWDEHHPVEDMDFSPDGAYSGYNWELFFHVPLFIADQLRRNQRFAEARDWLHFIFDPTDTSGLAAPERYWITRPFFQAAQSAASRDRIEDLLDPARSASQDLFNQVGAWADDPFNAHRVARLRPVAYQKHVVMKYLDNLIEWGDHLYRGATDWEDINEATQLYVLAADILGRRPERLPARGRDDDKSYAELRDSIGVLGNAAIERAEAYVGKARPTKRELLGEAVDPRIASSRPAMRPLSVPYFCFPRNDKLLAYWDTVADRLFKIRHCQNIDGGALDLPLFEPPLDPGALARARELGVDLRDALSPATDVLPYRYSVLVQQANELCREVRSFGTTLQSALERRDAEDLALLRSTQEVDLLERVRATKEKQLEEAEQARAALDKTVEMTTHRRDYYAGREFMNAGEAANLALLTQTIIMEHAAGALDLAGNILQLIPDFKVGAPFSIGATFGGSNLGPALRAFAAFTRSQGTTVATQGSMAATLAGYQRRQDEWNLQRDLADKELQQLERQIAGADVRVAIAQNELAVHERQVENTIDAHAVMRDKFSNRELFDWMSGQIAASYFQAYQLAYQACQRAERAYQHELATDATFFRPGYWDSLRAGLLAGDKLQYDLKRMEMAYVEGNTRELELTKHISLRELDPLALVALRENGECFVTVPEQVFARDFSSHFLRRIKSVGLTMPCVTGPFTGVPCTLTLVDSRVRDTADGPLRAAHTAVRSTALSSARDDAGVFELSFRDERYLPFEGAGAVSQWRIQLPQGERSFDYRTITDVVLHLRYTARDGGVAVTDAARDAPPISEDENRLVLFSAKREFGDAWHELRHSEEGATPTLELTIGPRRLPFRLRSSGAAIEGLQVLAVVENDRAAELSVGCRLPDGTVLAPQTLAPSAEVTNARHAAFSVPSLALPTEESTWTLSLESGDASELDDVFVLLAYSA